MTLTEAIRTGALDGYTPSAPSREVALEDRAILAGVRCPCGHIGLQHRPFRKAGSYRAWAVCPCCQKSTEY